MNYQTDAIQAIEAQQAKVKPRSPQWMVGEQLKDICRREPRSAELIGEPLWRDRRLPADLGAAERTGFLPVDKRDRRVSRSGHQKEILREREVVTLEQNPNAAVQKFQLR